MSGLPERRLSQRSRRPAITRALDYLSGEGLSLPEPLEPSGDGDNSFDTLPLAEDTITEVRREPSLNDRMADLEHTVEVMCQHLARNQDLILEGIRRLVGGQRDLESAVSRRPTTNTTVASRLPINPIGSPLRTVADFRALNARLADSEVRSQLVSYLACLGGRSLDDFTKRVYYALFVDDISLHINFKRRKMKEGLSDSPTYGVIKSISSPELNESHIEMDDSDDTLPSREQMRVEEWQEPVPNDRMANLERALALLIQHSARLSKKMDLILDSNRRLHGRLRELEAKVLQRPPAPAAAPLPQNPIKQPMRTGADFRHLNALMEDNAIRNQLVGCPFIIYTKN
nr:unnamed protein product [Spirometra erinaceieuropaei]